MTPERSSERKIQFVRITFVHRWLVPISYTTIEDGFSNTKTNLWLRPDEELKTISLEGKTDSEQPIFVNVQQTGFYR